MERITTGTAVALVAMSLASAPAAAQNREHMQMAAELRILQEQNQQLAVTLTQISQVLGEQAQAIKGLHQRLNETDEAIRRTAADQKLLLDGMSSELRVLRERSQDTTTRIGTLAEEVEAIRTLLPSLAQPAAPFDPDNPDAPGAAAAPVRSGLSPNRLFQTAYSDFTAGDYRLAISGFQAYLAEFARSEQADDAQVYVGESYMRLKQYAEAITAFRAAIQNYPRGDKVPDAHFRLGETLRSLGQTEAARAEWERLIATYPDNAYATLAQQRIDGLPPPLPQP